MKTKFLFLNNVFQDTTETEPGKFNSNDYNNINELIDVFNQWQIEGFHKNKFEIIIAHIIKVFVLSPNLIDKTFNVSNDVNVLNMEKVRLIKYIITNCHELYWIYCINISDTNKHRKEYENIFRDLINKYPQYVEILKHYNIIY